MNTVYLAGVITGKTYDESEAWRNHAKSVLEPCGIVCLSPLRGKDYLGREGVLSKSTYDYPLSTAKGIVGRDGFDVTRCDLMLWNVVGAQAISRGCMWELGVAWACRKPVVAVIEPGNPNETCFLDETANWKTSDLDEALQFVLRILLP